MSHRNITVTTEATINFPFIIWKPGTPSSSGYAETWAEVESWITKTWATQSTKLTVYLDDSNNIVASNAGNGDLFFQIPAATNFNCQGLVFFKKTVTEKAYNIYISIADGAVLRNVAGVDGVKLLACPTITTPLVFDSFMFLNIKNGGLINGRGQNPPN